MKALFLRLLAVTLLLVTLLYTFACSPGGQNQNLTGNQNQANGNRSSRDLRRCEYGSDPVATGKEIKKKIKEKMSDELKKELKDEANPSGTFTLEIKKAEQAAYFEAYVTGNISGDDNLKELGDILNDFQDKEFCLRVVFLMPNPASPTAAGDPGFRWNACEYPLKTCPNGECSEKCGMETNTNTNMNTNTNGNSNSNVNTNRKGNTNN